MLLTVDACSQKLGHRWAEVLGVANGLDANGARRHREIVALRRDALMNYSGVLIAPSRSSMMVAPSAPKFTVANRMRCPWMVTSSSKCSEVTGWMKRPSDA